MTAVTFGASPFMAKGKKSFILYADINHTIEKLSDDEAGRLFKHMLQYVNDLSPIAPDRMTEILFEPIKQQLKRDLEKWGEKSIKRSEIGRLGGIKSADVRRTKTNQNEPIGSSSTKRNQNEHVNVNVSVNDNVNESVKTLDIEQRKIDFANSLRPFLETYGQSTLAAFCDYWTEHGLNDKKMRFEKEKTFGVSQRLNTWKRNERSFNRPNAKLSTVELFKTKF